ncbi:MAG: polysaccharide pyruvyl transferase family protein [Pseudomonadota bacterium]
MSVELLLRRARLEGAVPLAWQGGAAGDARVPLAGALAPVVVALLAGLPVMRVPFASRLPRLVASGTVGQNAAGGDVVFWGSGSARTATPSDGRRRRFRADPGTRRHLAACRGPFSAALLSGGVLPSDALPVLGEPAGLIAQFHRPVRTPRHELGIVLSPEEEASAEPGRCRPRPGLAPFALDPSGGEGVRLISGLIAPSLAGVRHALDAILACKRILSTAPEALAIARAYGIPSLPLALRSDDGARQPGLEELPLRIDGPLALPLADLYAGLGNRHLTVWRQGTRQSTPWQRLIAAIDHATSEPAAAADPPAADVGRGGVSGSAEGPALALALPLDLDPIQPAFGADIWDHPVLRSIAFAEDLPAMRGRERAREEALAASARHRKPHPPRSSGDKEAEDTTSLPGRCSDPWAALEGLPLAQARMPAQAPKLQLIRIEPPPADENTTKTAGDDCKPRPAIRTAYTGETAIPLGRTALWHLRRGLAALETAGAPGLAATAEARMPSPDETRSPPADLPLNTRRPAASPAVQAPATKREAFGTGNITPLRRGRPQGADPGGAVDRSRHCRPGAADPYPGCTSDGIAVPLCWAAGARQDGFANIGDALSAVVVSALSGLPVRHMAARSPHERLAAVGTIGHSLKGGHVHLWGTGLDATIHPENDGPWSRPTETRFSVHATRGPETAATLRRAGIPAPEVFGDPVYLLPRLWPLDEVERRYELGIVLHLSELDEKTPAGLPKEGYRRYAVPESLRDSVRIINMYAESSLEAFREKIAEIVSCRRILSTSLHGLVIADAYGIPSGWFGFFGRGLHRVDLLEPESRIDHRMRDLYGGLGWHEAPVFSTPRHEETDFDAAINAIDTAMAPSLFDPADLIASFPGPLGVDPEARHWPLPRNALEGVIL